MKLHDIVIYKNYLLLTQMSSSWLPKPLEFPKFWES